MSDAALHIDGIGVRFGGLWALSEVSFEVERGAVLGLIGPNGSGKTTLMNVISGVYKPTTGEVRYGGHRIADVPTHDVCHLGIARTFQIVKPFANLNARENVAVGAMYGREGSKRSTRAAFGFVGAGGPAPAPRGGAPPPPTNCWRSSISHGSPTGARAT